MGAWPCRWVTAGELVPGLESCLFLVHDCYLPMTTGTSRCTLWGGLLPSSASHDGNKGRSEKCQWEDLEVLLASQVSAHLRNLSPLFPYHQARQGLLWWSDPVPCCWCSSVPLLVTPTGPLTDSKDILRFASEYARGSQSTHPGADLARELWVLDTLLSSCEGQHQERLIHVHIITHLRSFLDEDGHISLESCVASGTLTTQNCWKRFNGLRSCVPRSSGCGPGWVKAFGWGIRLRWCWKDCLTGVSGHS